MVFEGVPAGPFHGRDAIEAAYAAQPPDDEIVLVGDPEERGGEAVAPYAWKREGTRAGEIRLTARDGKIAHLVVTFSR